MKNLLAIFMFTLVASCSTVKVSLVEFSGERDIAAAKSCPELVRQFFNIESDLQTSIINKQTKLGYRMAGKILYKKIKGKDVVVGEVEVIKPRYLFEWQDEEMHDYWVKNKGITRKDMDFILKEQTQAYGRGYYISLDPVDSSSYGSHLTVFEVKEPMIVIKDLNADFYDDPLVLNELRSIGYAGNRGTATWFNIFNENYLQNAKRLDYLTLQGILVPENGVAEFNLQKLLGQKSISSVLEKNINEVIKKVAAGEELTEVMQKIATSNPLAILKLPDSPVKTMVLRDAFSAMKPEQLLFFKRTLELLEPSELKTVVRELKKTMDSIPVANEFFELFDYVDFLKYNKKSPQSLNFTQMMNEAKKYKGQLENVNLKKIKNSTQFLETAAKTFKINYKVRDYEVVMGAYKKDKFTLSLSSDFVDSRLNMEIMGAKVMSNDNSYYKEYEISYFGFENFMTLERVLDNSKLARLIEAMDVDKRMGLRTANEIILEMLFTPSDFNKLAKGFFPDEKFHPYLLYKIFISIHPYQDGNGRASRLYYRWLMENQFPEMKPLHIPFYDMDVFTKADYFTDKTELNWYLSRLWTLNGKTDEEIAKRAAYEMKINPFYDESGFMRDVIGLIYD